MGRCFSWWIIVFRVKTDVFLYLMGWMSEPHLLRIQTCSDLLISVDVELPMSVGLYSLECRAILHLKWKKNEINISINLWHSFPVSKVVRVRAEILDGSWAAVITGQDWRVQLQPTNMSLKSPHSLRSLLFCLLEHLIWECSGGDNKGHSWLQ